MDRALIIPMRRRLPGEPIEELPFEQLEALCLPIRRRLVRWTADHAEALRGATPSVPPGLVDDRARSNWRPLFALSDAAGGPWPDRARRAAVLVAGRPEELGVSIELLADVSTILDEHGDEVIATAELLKQLLALEDRPWPTFSSGRPLTAHALARLLKRFGISPAGTVWLNGRTVKGYRAVAFADARARYVPAEGGLKASGGKDLNDSGPELANSKRQDFSGLEKPDALKPAETPHEHWLPYPLTLPEGGSGDNGHRGTPTSTSPLPLNIPAASTGAADQAGPPQALPDGEFDV